jgi:hypothetical protein
MTKNSRIIKSCVVYTKNRMIKSCIVYTKNRMIKSCIVYTNNRMIKSCLLLSEHPTSGYLIIECSEASRNSLEFTSVENLN